MIFHRGDIVSFKNPSDILTALLVGELLVVSDCDENDEMIPIAKLEDGYVKSFWLANCFLTLIQRATYEIIKG